ncbi:MFS transporter [Niallia oryzisoli]|uniref:MFS transporter n=1 Tax=Niallia oryzisoli TaxID=1737571 RepID=A0ABZ2CH43_9BACI
MLYIGFIFFLITTCLYFIVTNFSFLLINRFLNGAALGMASTATGTIVAKIIPNERRGEGTGYYALSVVLAAAFGPFLGMMLTHQIGLMSNFILCSIVLVISFITIFFLKVPQVTSTKKKVEKQGGFSLQHFFEVKAIPIAIIAFFVAFGYSSILTFLTAYTQEIHLANIGSFFFVVYALFTVASRPFTGRLFDERGENWVMYPSFISFAIGLLILGEAHQGIALLIAGGLVGLGYGTFSASAQAISIKVSPKEHMGLATSTYFIFLDAGIGIGPFVLGMLVPSIGYRGMYVSMAVVLFICFFLYYFLHGRSTNTLKLKRTV